MSVEKVGMLPIVGNFTSELLDEFDPEFVEWMLKSLASAGGEEVKTVRRAIADSTKFLHTMGAAILASKQTSESMGDGRGESSMTVLLLIAGWKLCEHRMEQIAAKSVA